MTLTNSPANIITMILVNVALTSAAQYAGQVTDAAHAEWWGLQAAFAMSCKERGMTKKQATRRFAKEARAAAVSMVPEHARRWLLTVPQMCA